MRRFALVGVCALACFREAPPCDEASALALLAECRAHYEQCKAAGHEDVCPKRDECVDRAYERDTYCKARIDREGE